jgi:penicillin amidase
MVNKSYFYKFPFLMRCISFVIIPILTLFIALFYWVKSSLPVVSGDIMVDDLQEPLIIQYDKFGVSHITAKRDIDAVFGLGFAHAQNRLWQMEMNRRTASGQLSEVLGEQALSSDIFMRTLGLSRNAKKMWLQLDKHHRSFLSHYVKGVNQGIKKLKVLPIEYQLLGFEPSPWTEVDSLLWMQLLNVQLSTNLGAELHRSSLLQAFGLDKTNDLMPDITRNDLIVLADSNVVPNQYQVPKRYVGSNAWVISGKNSASGKPMLANDPHLVNTLPSTFYLANIKGELLSVKGATFPGLPFVIMGKNQDISWGLTTMMADTQDIFLEKINPNNQNQYEVDGQYLDMEVYIEEITIKKKSFQSPTKPYKLEIRRTKHGPILSDISGAHNNFSYSLRWTGDDQNGGTFKSFLSLNYAKNWDEFNDALKGVIAPIHNFVYADKTGHIGLVAAGAFPIRRSNNGALPVKGWLSQNDWQGWIPDEEWPRKFDPDNGVLITANNNWLDESYPYYISSDWAPQYRAKRIESLITSKLMNNVDGLTVADFRSIQLDIKNPANKSLLPFLITLEGETHKQKQALKLMQNWEGSMKLDSPQASIYTSWMAQFVRLLIEDDSARVSRAVRGELALSTMINQENQPFVEQVLLNNKNTWCDYRDTTEIESCKEMLLIALTHAINELEKTLGTNMKTWHWSKLHNAHFPHFPFSDRVDSPRLPNSADYFWASLFHRSIPSVGGGNTINVAPVSLEEENRFEQFLGPSYRQIIDWGTDEIDLFSLSTGQSGNVISSHYDDLLKRHQQGLYFNIKQPIDGQRLILIPKKTLNKSKFNGN